MIRFRAAAKNFQADILPLEFIYGDMNLADVKRLKKLEKAITEVKKILFEYLLENSVLVSQLIKVVILM